jgi:hypothetical protein
MSLLGSSTDLFDLLGMGPSITASTSKHELDVPSDENYVICAVLDDANRTRVRLGSARFYTASKTYHMLDGSLQVAESAKSKEDGLYRDASGTYALMTESEFAVHKSKQNKPVVPTPVVSEPLVDFLDEAPAAAKPTAVPVMQQQPVGLSPTKAPLPPVQSLPAAAARLPPIVPKHNGESIINAETVGCGPGSETKTVFATGNFEGDSTRLDVVLEQSRPLALKAAGHGNRVMYAFMGNIMPDVHKPTSIDTGVDSFTRVLELSERGIELNGTHSVSAADIVTLSGVRELAWLILANPNSETREITAFDDPNARAVMLRKGVLSDMKGSLRNSGMRAHNNLVDRLQPFETLNDIAVGMILKLISMTQFTMQAPGVVSLFARRLLKQGNHDNASLALLLEFVSDLNGIVDEDIYKLFGNGELTPEGLAIMPAAKAVVAEVIAFAHNAAMKYMRRSKLLHCIVSSDVLDGAGGLWLAPRGTDYGSMVGKLPSGVDHNSLRVKWKKGPSHLVEWSRALNREFRHFVKVFMDGTNTAPIEMYQAYVAMAIESSDCSLPLQDLAANASATCNGITASNSTPFGTLQRRILVKKPGQATSKHSDLLKVMDQWTNINTDAYTPSTYWSVATWCGGTKSDIGFPPFVVNLTEKLGVHLWHVSITLASLLSARVKEGTVKDYGIASLSGVLGPSVSLSSGSQKQVMRIASFTHDKIDTAFVVLLPEAFVQWSLDYYNYDIEHATGAGDPMIATEGFLALPDESSVPLGFPGISVAETEHIRSELGTRVWALPKKRSEKSITTFTSADYAAIKAMHGSEGPTRMLTIPGYTVFHTRQNNLDPFSGLQIGLATIPVKGYEARMTIVADSMPSHDAFRVVAT